MKTGLQLIAWTVVTATILFAAITPASGVVFHGPLAVLGLGLIGLGLCVEARKRFGSGAATAARGGDDRPARQ